MIAKKIEREVMELKSLVRRSMSDDDLERAAHSLNSILAENARVRGLENAALLGDGEAGNA